MTDEEKGLLIDELIGNGIPFVCLDPTDKVSDQVVMPSFFFMPFCSSKPHLTTGSFFKWRSTMRLTGKGHLEPDILQGSMGIMVLFTLHSSALRYSTTCLLNFQSHHIL
jgi:hypothetical protein